MRPLRVALFTPPYHCGMVESAGVWMPLGLAYLSGSLKAAGHETLIYDAMSRFESSEVAASRLIAEKPDVVAGTAFTASLPAALEVLHLVKAGLPEVITVLGGVHPTFMAEEILANPVVDYVVRGEGEKALPELLACLATGDSLIKVLGVSWREGGFVWHAPDRPLARNLDVLPIDWSGLEWDLYHYRTKPGSRLAISSWSRGCTHDCSFCSQRKMWRGCWRGRSVDSVVGEVKMLAERYGVDTLEVADECPTSDRERWRELMQRLAAEDLGVELLVETRADDIVADADAMDLYRQAGVLHMYVGVESGRQQDLDWMGKGLRVEQSRMAIELLNNGGIITETSFLLGYPDDTPESVAESIELSRLYDPDLAFFLAITPWPYADMWERVADRVEVNDYSKYNLINPIIRPRGMSREELSAMLGSAFAQFYGRKMRELETMPQHKREYLMAVSKLLMDESYLSAEVTAAMKHARLQEMAAVS